MALPDSAYSLMALFLCTRKLVIYFVRNSLLASIPIGPSGDWYVKMSFIKVPPACCSKWCSCLNDLNAPDTISSTKYYGERNSVIFEVRFCHTPRCFARQVTVSFSFISPFARPAITRSPVAAVETIWRSMLRDKSKQTWMGVLMKVVRVMMNCVYANQPFNVILQS